MKQNITFAKHIVKKEFYQDGLPCSLTGTAKLESLSGQTPYFSITGELLVSGRLKSFGMLHDEIKNSIPELRPFLKWHLVSIEKPLHYIANALYWAGLQGYTDGQKDSPPNRDHLKSTIIYGALSTDSRIRLTSYMGLGNPKSEENIKKAERFTKVLTARLPALRGEFFKALTQVFGIGWVYPIEEFYNKRIIELLGEN